MIRLMIVLGCFGAGIGVFSDAVVQRTTSRGEVDHADAELAQVRIRIDSMNEASERTRSQIEELQARLRSARITETVTDPLRRQIESIPASQLASHGSEGSLHELGFSWESSPDHVLVPKEILGALKVDAIDTNGHLSKVAASLLDLDRAQIAATQEALSQAQRAYVERAAKAAQRTPLNDPEIVRWELPIDLELEATLMGELKRRLDESIGQERRDLLLKFAGRPLAESFGNLGGVKATLTVYWAEGAHGWAPAFRYDLATKNGSLGSRYGSVVNDPPFPIYAEDLPPLFRPAFPRGWAELLAREGIELPKDK